MRKIYLLIDPTGRPSKTHRAYPQRILAEDECQTINSRLKTMALRGNYWRVSEYELEGEA